jgi:hypothetical protein
VSDADFGWRATKDGRVRISRAGRVVTTLAGRSARRFLGRVEGAAQAAAQLEMARATGNYKRGNER